MATVNLGDVRSVKIKPLLNKTRVRLILQFAAPTQYESIEFELPCEGALKFAKAVQDVLSSGNSPSPPTRARVVGRPILVVVK
jgi:hypothetical protein